jgi:hypothetical protein
MRGPIETQPRAISKSPAKNATFRGGLLLFVAAMNGHGYWQMRYTANGAQVSKITRRTEPDP